jgi:hypothetical protein
LSALNYWAEKSAKRQRLANRFLLKKKEKRKYVADERETDPAQNSIRR